MTFLRSIPWYIYCFALAVGLFCLSCVGVVRYGAAEYERGRRSVTDGVRFDTVLVGQVRKADSIAQAHTDTVVQRLVVTRWKTDTVLRDVPDSLRRVPEIAALVTVTAQLTAQVDTLAHTLDVERATSRLRASVDSAALVSARLVIVAQGDSIVQLKKRPQWRTVGAVGVLAFVAGLLR
jgi:hypothetical protein